MSESRLGEVRSEAREGEARASGGERRGDEGSADAEVEGRAESWLRKSRDESKAEAMNKERFEVMEEQGPIRVPFRGDSRRGDGKD
jgi:hypothetical protein